MAFGAIATQHQGICCTRQRRYHLDSDLHSVPLTTISEWIAFAKSEKIDLTVVGPEAPLSVGVVDAFRAEGLKILAQHNTPPS